MKEGKYYVLKCCFSKERDRECRYCMLGVARGDYDYCAGIGNRPRCPEEGCRKDCPLVPYETVSKC